MRRWEDFDFDFLRDVSTGGNPTPYFSIYYEIINNLGIRRSNCHDVVTRYTKYENTENTVFLIRSINNRKLSTKVFTSISNIFALINKHYQLSEEDSLNVWTTNNSKFLEISCGAWWGENLMRKMLMFKLIRFAFNYRGEYKTETPEEINETVINIVNHYANEELLKDYKGQPMKHHENKIVADNFDRIVTNILHCYKIPSNSACTNLGFITFSAIIEMNSHLTAKNFYE